MARFSVRIIVSPLACECFDFDACIFNELVGWEGHVRVNVPILHALNDVDGAVVILQHPVEEGTFGPVIVTGVGHHASRKVGGWAVHVAFDVSLAKGVSVL